MSAKVRVLDQLLHNIRSSTSEKIVLVSNYTSTLDLLAKLLSSLSLPFLRLDGSTPAQKRLSLVEDFNRHPANVCFAFLLSAKAGGTGLNLIGASRLVLFDVDWNPATDVQAMARIHRDGQKRHCRIYRILLKGSLEEKIWQRQVTKIGLADSVMENKDNVAQFSRDELKDLFRLDEESQCQTHELLGCDCGGWGKSSSLGNKDEAEVVPATDDDEPQKPDKDDDEPDELCDLPDLPTLIKASEVDMEEQEYRLRANRTQRPRTSARRRSKKEESDNEDDENKPINQKHANNNKMQQSLSAYTHIDPSLLSHSPEAEEDIRCVIDDDDGLLSLVREEDNRVKFVFKKGGSDISDGKGDAEVDVKSDGARTKVEAEVKAEVETSAKPSSASMPIVLD